MQLAAQLRRTSNVLNRYGVHRLDPMTGVDICLIEASSAVLPGLGTRIADRVGEQLARLNIRVECSARVTSVSGSGLTIAGQPPMQADVVVWAAGIAAPSMLASFGLPVNAKGQIRVLPNLQSVEDEHVYAIGDCASCRPQELDAELPTRAQVAYQQALYLSQALPRRLAGKHTAGFRYRDYGSLVSLAGSSAIANDPLLKHRSFFQTADIAAVESVTPTTAGWTRCRANRTAGFDSQGLPSRVAGDDTITHTGENTIDPTENLAHGNDQRRARSARDQALDAAVTQSAEDPTFLCSTPPGRRCPERERGARAEGKTKGGDTRPPANPVSRYVDQLKLSQGRAGQCV
ncbi:NAD(P)/FAD-dependent oxidoreductase [Cupriavidus necator]|uniref:NAD(P)/FAD-dependent oxidoreductase n=1 Tax=Cupriavidus necator TaxID=106590 RepID=UPI003F4FFCB6